MLPWTDCFARQIAVSPCSRPAKPGNRISRVKDRQVRPFSGYGRLEHRESRISRQVSFDLSQAFFTEQGMTDFYWPVSHAERVSVKNRYLEFYNGYIRSLDHDDSELLALGHSYLAVEVTTIIWAQLLKSRLAGASALLPDYANRWQFVVDKKRGAIPVPKNMEVGLERPAFARRWGRMFRPPQFFYGLRS